MGASCPRHVSSWHPVLDWPLCSCSQGRIASIGNGAFKSIAASLLRKLNSCSHLSPPAACHSTAWLGSHTPNRQMVITYSAFAGKKKTEVAIVFMKPWGAVASQCHMSCAVRKNQSYGPLTDAFDCLQCLSLSKIRNPNVLFPILLAVECIYSFDAQVFSPRLLVWQPRQ